jgi:hypothetical protein
LFALLLLPSQGHAQAALSDRDALRYIASHPDLIQAFGADPAKGRRHYEEWGLKEGREITFEPSAYTASYPDLMAAFGLDEIKAATHYIQWGYWEGRKVTFDGMRYIASHPDLINAFGADAAQGARHYIQWGYKEGRQATFSDADALRYIASYPDLINAFGTDIEKGLRHYVQWGYKEGRRASFDGLRYIASHPDLINAFGADAAQGVRHYIQWGYKEGRQSTFSDLDTLRYIASYPDIINAFGTDTEKGLRHYVQWGYKEGRKITFDPLIYTASYPDLIAAFGLDETKSVTHYIQWGNREGRKASFDVLRYIASHPDLINAFGADAAQGVRHYIQWGYKEGRQTTFSDLDALRYIASFPDLIRAFGTDALAGIRHYVTWGYREGRKAVFDALAYIASYGDLITAFGADLAAGARHYITWGYNEGRKVTFDAEGYLAKYPDLRAAFGADTTAATWHFLTWGYREGRSDHWVVSTNVGAGGAVTPTRIAARHGDRMTLTVSAQIDHRLGSISGCGGSLVGNTFTTAPITSSCSISASFTPKAGSGTIAGVWSGTDSSRPAFISVSSAADDSFLQVVKVAADGGFEVTGLEAGKQYFVEAEQSGTRAASAIVYPKHVNSASIGVETFRPNSGSGGASGTVAVVASPGDFLVIDGAKVPGLNENEFNYRWEGNPTASGAEYSSYVPAPVKVDLIPTEARVADPQAAVRLAEEYGIVLVDPSVASTTTDQMTWTSEYAERLLHFLKLMPIPVASEGARGWSQVTYLELTASAINNDIERISGDKYMGSRLRISAAAFPYASPLLARVEGKRGIFFSNRLFRAVVRMVTEDGTRRDLVREIMKRRYGITVATDDNDALLVVPATCSPKFPSDCLDAEWKVFNPEEFFDLMSILEEFPEGMRDLSQPGKAIGLRHLLRRRDGVPHPLYPQAPAVAWPEFGYAEFMEAGFAGTRGSRHALIVHEKAHFIWSGMLTPAQRYDWLRQSGWYRVPQLTPGQDVRAAGRCDQWQQHPATWVPPNVTNSDLEFSGAVAHDEQKSDGASLKRDWASCSTTQFVSPYAAQNNPNEDFAESVAAFMLNPDLLRSRALPKYEFIRDRLMQGAIYLSKIRQDLTFEVLNLYPDYVYPGKIKSIEIKVSGAPNEDKIATFRISLHVSENCDSAKNPGCFQGAAHGGFRVFSRVNTFYDVGLKPVTPAGDVLEGRLTLSKHAASGWWQVVNITVVDAVGNTRISKQSSKDFGWKMYVNNPLEDLTPPAYIKNSLKMTLFKAGDPGASSLISGDEREMVVSWRVNEANRVVWCYAAVSFDDAFNTVESGQRIYKGSSESYADPIALPQPQPDGATHACVARHRVTRYWTSGAYYVPFIRTIDIASNDKGERFSFRGRDGTLEGAPELILSSPQSDAVPPVMNISPCKTDSLDEKCLRIVAKPTNPQNPDGETVVDIYYWVYEDQPLVSASGFNGGIFHLRDPLGKTFHFYLDSGTAAGVVDRSPLRLIDGHVYFTCPRIAPPDCTAITQVQYQARVILPVGSAPGIWGLYDFRVGDKALNGRDYDFTELYRFTPFGAGGDGASASSSGNTLSVPFQFSVSGSAHGPLTDRPYLAESTGRVEPGPPTVLERLVSFLSGMVGSVIDAGSMMFEGSEGGRSDRGRVVVLPGATKVAPVPLPKTPPVGNGRSVGPSRESIVVSEAEDAATGSRYRIVLQRYPAADGRQGWSWEYLGSGGVMFRSAQLPATAEVLWWRMGSSVRLGTSAWARVCGDRAWAVQDGYQLVFNVADRSLSDVLPGQLWVESQAEVTVISDVRCAFGGSLRVEGYALDVNESEPMLGGDRVAAKRFGFWLDRSGGLSKREVKAALFDLREICANPPDEQLQFCAAAGNATNH